MSELTGGTAGLIAAAIVDGSQALDPVVSPDGRWVAWATSTMGEGEQPVSELWLAPVGEHAVPVRLTDGGVPARLPCWSPDSAWLFHVAGEEICRVRITAGGPAGCPGRSCAGAVKSPEWFRSSGDSGWPSWPVTS